VRVVKLLIRGACHRADAPVGRDSGRTHSATASQSIDPGRQPSYQPIRRQAPSARRGLPRPWQDVAKRAADQAPKLQRRTT
jgi:hypothetical protein